MTLVRNRLPTERKSVTRVFRIPYTHKDGRADKMQFYFTAGLYEDGKLGEIFIKADRPGTLAAGALDAVAMMMSMMLQHGVPLADILPKLRHLRFEPSGFTGDDTHEFPSCSSPLDLLAQWLARRFLPDPNDVKTGVPDVRDR